MHRQSTCPPKLRPGANILLTCYQLVMTRTRLVASLSFSVACHLQMEKFTGADLTEICQRAAKIAIRENIMKVRPARAHPSAAGDFFLGLLILVYIYPRTWSVHAPGGF